MSSKIQELERFNDMPLNSNKLYNVCLLASTLLLIKEEIFEKFTSSTELSEYMKFINIGKSSSVDGESSGVKGYRSAEYKRKEDAKRLGKLDAYKNELTGNKIAVKCVTMFDDGEDLLARATVLSSDINLEELLVGPPIVVQGTILGGKKKKRKTKKRRKTKKKRA